MSVNWAGSRSAKLLSGVFKTVLPTVTGATWPRPDGATLLPSCVCLKTRDVTTRLHFMRKDSTTTAVQNKMRFQQYFDKNYWLIFFVLIALWTKTAQVNHKHDNVNVWTLKNHCASLHIMTAWITRVATPSLMISQIWNCSNIVFYILKKTMKFSHVLLNNFKISLWFSNDR